MPIDSSHRYFDPALANRALPLVRRVVRDIVRVHAAIEDAHERARDLARAGKTDEAEAEQDALQALVYERRRFIEELGDIGCELKDPRIGLIDFPARLDDRDVCLCWKLGEARVANWHETTDGFAGRRPIDDETFVDSSADSTATSC